MNRIPERIVIVGASSGIGLELARTLAAQGHTLGLAARRTESLLELAASYPDGRISVAPIDITMPAAATQLTELAHAIGGMDLYLHVAGIGYDNPPLDPDREAAILDTNSTAFARMISAAYGYFRTTGRRGRIAAITSVAGTRAIPDMAAYSASKKCDQTYLGALAQLARIQHMPIRITDIRPGWIRTPLLHNGQSYPLEMTPAYAIPLIMRALRRAPRVAYIDWRWRLVCALWRLIPRPIWEHLRITFA